MAKTDQSDSELVSIILDMTLTLLHMEDGIRLLSGQIPPQRESAELREVTATIRNDMNALVEKIAKLVQGDA